MLTINLKDAKAKFSSMVNEAMNGEVVTITRHGKPVAALVSVDVAEAIRQSMQSKPPGLVHYLKTFPGDSPIGRNPQPSRPVEL
ncbi:type II toxin-antitoxin system Phd/YefM family antitoxin [Acidithiobacillus thiooxidans]|jgi:prevent-host-death family protein|uniref:type II toxin-antitoxin system Phd/YefM family antitoxin n=1 Tax=Acidithiobacillus TaxID=119977 RepID=UPI001879DF94|nr:MULTISPECIES: type II toxin-antitoxin system Phd/YefM family antitoxin [Acidithiobacillus]MBE7567794.1 type II toxin-antitoxin system Phd/YefM family antitoxin [Acidithiobacillus sp. HP-11]MBU2751576.1 type II toxin-antitoxin system Phd/YefM family antitoxin [Acidithiobacillus thiooxidans]MBU2838600.1 type II toxin-antitoxin system Phd/YefM family antitoxin [Acidithiobacillus thiooxidans]